MSSFRLFVFSVWALALWGCAPGDAELTADTADHTVAKWGKLNLDFDGPATSETAVPNPFTDYRLTVVFEHDSLTLTVPGYYAADGNAAETGADSGSVWRVNFRPPLAGSWRYEATLARGSDLATAPATTAGQAVPLRGATGTVFVAPAGPDETGRLVRAHPRYLRWAESGAYFLKGGAGSPENLLAYQDFDGTRRHSEEFRDGESKTEGLHHFRAHAADWTAGDPAWRGGRGKGIIGAVNYLAGAGANSVYFLTMNINGDGKDVWPFRTHDDFTRFDCSKLDQWEILFDHMDDDLGMMLHVVLQETENETLLDGGDTGPDRRRYLREMIARFGHHRAVTWDIGEENGLNEWSKQYGYQDSVQQLAMAAYLADQDPYRNHIVVHTHPSDGPRRDLLTPLLGDAALKGLALQVDEPENAYAATREWVTESADHGQPWVASVDEIGPWYRGLDPDAGTIVSRTGYRDPAAVRAGGGLPNNALPNNQDSLRRYVLWGNLMAGGAGAEWYFGAFSAHNDLGMEDWRSRDRAWRWTRRTLDFFRAHVPFATMEPTDRLTPPGAWTLADPGRSYLVYLPEGGTTTLDLTSAPGTYRLRWYDARNDEMTDGGTVAGRAKQTVTAPAAGDFAALLERMEE